MPRFRVTAVEILHREERFYKDIEAPSAEEASVIGEEQDWTDWEKDISSDREDLTEAYIENVEELS